MEAASGAPLSRLPVGIQVPTSASGWPLGILLLCPLQSSCRSCMLLLLLLLLLLLGLSLISERASERGGKKAENVRHLPSAPGRALIHSSLFMNYS